ncbi:MAG: hypothetical protein LBR08_03520 [Bacteroidales bacterium]|jgi:hypothetical protein|nr:hypothetical protein [Bacteroidales bacterium]
MTKDWFPKKMEDLYQTATQTLTYANDTENNRRMGLAGIATWMDNTFLPAYHALEATYAEWVNPATRTPEKIAAVNDARKHFTPLYRKLYRVFLRDNPMVSDIDLLAMGLPRRSGNQVPTPMPSKRPEANINSSTPRQLTVNFRNEGSSTSVKPHGVHGVEMRWAVLPNPPASTKELVNSTFDTRSPFILKFTEEERGKTVYLALRWENIRGEKGSFSKILNAIVP